MGEKKPGKIVPYNEYVRDLGAHEPPAHPEKELASAQGAKQALLAAVIAIFIWFLFLDPTYGWLHWRSTALPTDETGTGITASVSTESALEGTTVSTEEQKGIGHIAFLNKKTGRLENLLGGETYRISPGDTIEVWGYSDFAEIEHIVYYIPEIHPENTTLPSAQLEDGIGFISLPDYPDGEYFHLYVKVQDTGGNNGEYQQYILVFESAE